MNFWHFTKRPYKLFFQLSGVFALVLALGGGLMFTLNMQNRMVAQQQSMLERTAIRAGDKARLFNQWRDELIKNTRPLVEAELTRLFVTEGNKTTDGTLPDTLASHGVYLERVLEDLKQNAGLRTAMLLGENARVAVQATGAVGSFNPQSIPYFNQAIHSRQVVVGSPVAADGRTYLEVFIPLDDFDAEAPTAIGALYVQGDVTGVLTTLAEEAGVHEQSYLVFNAAEAGTWYQVSLGKIAQLKDDAFNTGAIKEGVDDKIFRKVAFISNSPYAVIHQTDYDWGMRDYAHYASLYLWLIIFQVVAACGLFMGLLWFGLSRRDRHRVRHLGQMAEALIKAIEIRDDYLGGHHERFAKLSVDVGDVLGLSRRDRATLYYAAKLSGIGRMFIPKKILNKKGALTDAERTVVQGQVENTMQVLDQVDFELPIKQVIRQMHERADGSGYPNKLTLGDIDLRAQILGVCDAFCAMTRPRVYRDALPADEVLTRLQNSRDKFSPLVVEALIKVFQRSLEKTQ